jgi:NAD(P)H-dependent flavin oxidoreductase YrpB (nitropropane dioxygenase family)
MIQRSIRNAERVIKNRAAEKTVAMEQGGASLQELIAVISGDLGKKALAEGNLDSAVIACGQCVGLIHEIKSVKEVIDEIIRGARTLIGKLDSLADRE